MQKPDGISAAFPCPTVVSVVPFYEKTYSVADADLAAGKKGDVALHFGDTGVVDIPVE